MKEKDNFSTLFNALADAKMQVKDGFWENLEKDLTAIESAAQPVAPQHIKSIPLYRRWVAAASVLLIVAVGSVAFWYVNSQGQEIQEAFTELSAKIDTPLVEEMAKSTINIYNEDSHSLATAQHTNVNAPLSVTNVQRSNLSVNPALSPVSLGTTAEEEDDDEMVPFEVTFQIIEQGYINGGKPSNGLQNASNGNLASEETTTTTVTEKKASGWALKPAIGTSLSKGQYNMPLTAGMTLERKLNKTLSVEAGLLYNYLPVHNDENQSSLSLPVKLNVELAEGKKVDVYATVGGVAEKLLGKSFSEEPVQLAAMAGIGVRYKFNDHLAVYAEPTVSHYFETDGATKTLRTEQSVNVNLLCGVRMCY
ncbi:MAG: porin family protein [Bacteroidaceae bacterium]|nr:porin family protein [Bacteroidaceae bacterium]